MQQPHKKFVFFHTHVLTETVLERAIDLHIPIEIDISINKDGALYVGHPEQWYSFHDQEYPQNLVELDVALDMLSATNSPYVIDLKDRDAYAPLKKLLKHRGHSPAMVHVFAETLAFDMLESVSEPHRLQENIPTEILRDIKQELGVLVAASARGMEYVHDEDSIIESLRTITPWLDAYSGVSNKVVFTPKLREFLHKNNIEILHFIESIEQAEGIKIGATDDMAVAAKLNGTL